MPWTVDGQVGAGIRENRQTNTNQNERFDLGLRSREKKNVPQSPFAPTVQTTSSTEEPTEPSVPGGHRFQGLQVSWSFMSWYLHAQLPLSAFGCGCQPFYLFFER